MHLHRLFLFLLGYRSGAFELVPSERLAFQRTLYRLEQDKRKELTIREALQPHLAQKPCVFAGVRRPPFQRERNRGGQEIDDQKGAKENHQTLEARGIGGLRVEMFLPVIPERADTEHDVNEWRDQR